MFGTNSETLTTSQAEETTFTKIIIPSVPSYQRPCCLEFRQHMDGSVALIGYDQQSASYAWTASYFHQGAPLPEGLIWIIGSFLDALIQAGVVLPAGGFRTLITEQGKKFQIHRCELLKRQ